MSLLGQEFGGQDTKMRMWSVAAATSNISTELVRISQTKLPRQTLVPRQALILGLAPRFRILFFESN